MTQLVTDRELSENAAYALHYEIASQLIKVAVESGWVTLTGEVAMRQTKKPRKRRYSTYAASKAFGITSPSFGHPSR